MGNERDTRRAADSTVSRDYGGKDTSAERSQGSVADRHVRQHTSDDED